MFNLADRVSRTGRLQKYMFYNVFVCAVLLYACIWPSSGGRLEPRIRSVGKKLCYMHCVRAVGACIFRLEKVCRTRLIAIYAFGASWPGPSRPLQRL